MTQTHQFIDRVGHSDRFWARLMRIGVGGRVSIRRRALHDLEDPAALRKNL